MHIELIADYACVCGENPLWNPCDHKLYWTDIPSGLMFRYDPASNSHEQFFEGGVVGGFTLQEDGALLLFMARGEVRSWREGGETETVVEPLEAEADSRFNDVIADPEGRVFAGTMSSPSHQGRLYRLDPDGYLEVVLENIGCSNGIGFNLDYTQMYYTDSKARRIYIFDYDRKSGAIFNQRFFAEVSDQPDEGVPDGMTVDSLGNIWSARWDGSCLVRYLPDGREAERIIFPVRKVSSLTFGGDDLQDVYVTTAGGDHKATDGPHSGALFRFRAEAPGMPEFRSRIGL